MSHYIQRDILFLYKNKPNLEKFGLYCTMSMQTHIIKQIILY